MRFLPHHVCLLALGTLLMLSASCSQQGKTANTPTTAPAATQKSATTQAATAPARPNVSIGVTDLNGKPMANVEVVIDGCYIKPAKGKTDAAGNVMLPLPVNADKSFNIEAKAKGYATASTYWSLDEDGERPAKFTLKMEPGMSVGGRVVDQDQKPIAGATVSIWARKENPNGKEKFRISEQTKTDADGRWEIDGVAKNPDRFEVGYFHHQYLSTEYYPLDEQKVSPAFTDKTAVYLLKRGVPVTATILDSDGKPAVGANVHYGTDRGVSNAIPPVKTDAAGKFELGILAGTKNVLMITYKDHAPQLVSFTAGAKIEDIRLSKGQAISGDVVDKDGKPISGVRVSFNKWDERSINNPSLTTDKDGKFSWQHAGAGNYSVSVYKDSYLSLDDTPIAADQSNHFVLQPQPILRGKVIDAETRAPITNFKVTEGILWRNSQNVTWQLGNSDYMDKRAKRVADGAFEIRPYSAYRGLAYRINSDGYAPGDSVVLDPLKGDQEFTVELKKAANLSGTVLDLDGKPLAGIEVLAMPEGYAYLSNGEIRYWSKKQFPQSVTDSEGRFSLPPQADKFYICALNDDGYIYESATSKKFPATLKFRKWSKVVGTAKIGTKPVPAGSKISLSMDNRDPNDRINAHYETSTDAQGHFEFTRVIASDIYVSRMVQTSSNTWSNASFARGTIKPGETVEINLGGVGRPVTGKLLIPDTLPTGKWEISFVSITEDIKPKSPELPINLDEVPLKDRTETLKKWRESEDGKKWIQQMVQQHATTQRHYNASLAADYTFTANDVTAGKYRVQAYINTKRDQSTGRADTLAIGEATFVVPEIPGGVSDEPLDVGGVSFTAMTDEKSENGTPTYAFKTTDGKEIKSEDLRGKYVVIDLWVTYVPAFDQNAPVLQSIYDALGKRDDFAMFSINLDNSTKIIEQYIREYHATWPQAGFEDWTEASKLLRHFSTGKNSNSRNGIEIWLMDPEGKVIAHDTDAKKIREILQEKLK